MTAFITGGTGRLGKVLIDKLIGRQEIRALDPGNALLPEGVIVIKGDLNDIQALERGIAGCDVVFHLAALMDYSAPWKRLEEVNVQGTRNVVEMCAKHKVRRLIFISSTSVYGKELKEMPVDEETPTNPTDLYGKSKLEAERVVGEHFTDVPYTILRPGVIYGPTYLSYYSKVFRAIQQGKISILGDGKNIIPFVHAEDIVDAMLKAAAHDAAKGKIYVLSGNRTISQERIYEIAAQVLGTEFKKQYMNPGIAKALLTVSSIFNQSSITQEDINVLSSHRIFDTAKAETDLKWAPMPLEDGIKQMAELYKQKLLEAKKRKYLEYQREMQKKGKFLSIPEEEIGTEVKKQEPQPSIQSPPKPPFPQSKPRYFQPMPKDESKDESVSIIREPTPHQPAKLAQEIAKPSAKQEVKSQGPFFGFSLGAKSKPKSSKSKDATAAASVEEEKDTYPSNAASRLAPEISKPLPGQAPPKMPEHVLAKIQQAEKTEKEEQAKEQITKTSTEKKVVGSGRSWIDNVLKDIKKESEQKDNENK